MIAVHTAPDPGLISGDSDTAAAEELWISAGRVTGYDTRTGAVRWTRSGGMVAALGQSIMMFTGAAADRTMLMIDPSTGQTRWERPLAQGTQWTLGWHVRSQISVVPDAVVELAADGTVTTVDTATGHGSAMGRIPPGGTLGFAWQGVLGVRYGLPPGQKAAGPRSFAVFDIAGLTPLWSTPLTGEADLSPCGTDTLCDWGNGERRMDLHTGRDITGETLPVDVSERLRFGRFGAWNVVGPDQDTWLVYANPGTNQPGSGWLGRVDPTDPKMHVALLVKLPGRVDQCLAESAWLVCSSMNAGPGITYAIRRADLTARPPLR